MLHVDFSIRNDYTKKTWRDLATGPPICSFGQLNYLVVRILAS